MGRQQLHWPRAAPHRTMAADQPRLHRGRPDNFARTQHACRRACSVLARVQHAWRMRARVCGCLHVQAQMDGRAGRRKGARVSVWEGMRAVGWTGRKACRRVGRWACSVLAVCKCGDAHVQYGCGGWISITLLPAPRSFRTTDGHIIASRDKSLQNEWNVCTHVRTHLRTDRHVCTHLHAHTSMHTRVQKR